MVTASRVLDVLQKGTVGVLAGVTGELVACMCLNQLTSKVYYGANVGVMYFQARSRRKANEAAAAVARGAFVIFHLLIRLIESRTGAKGISYTEYLQITFNIF